MLQSPGEEDTGEVQVEAVLLVPPFVPAHDLLDQRGHHRSSGASARPSACRQPEERLFSGSEPGGVGASSCGPQITHPRDYFPGGELQKLLGGGRIARFSGGGSGVRREIYPGSEAELRGEKPEREGREPERKHPLSAFKIRVCVDAFRIKLWFTPSE